MRAHEETLCTLILLWIFKTHASKSNIEFPWLHKILYASTTLYKIGYCLDVKQLMVCMLKLGNRILIFSESVKEIGIMICSLVHVLLPFNFVTLFYVHSQGSKGCFKPNLQCTLPNFLIHSCVLGPKQFNLHQNLKF
jgi:hypothetical protein